MGYWIRQLGSRWRFTRLGATYLALGLLTTVAVAWASGAWLRVHYFNLLGVDHTSTEQSGWELMIYQRPGAVWIDGMPREWRGWRPPIWSRDRPLETAARTTVLTVGGQRLPPDAFPHPAVRENLVHEWRSVNLRGWPLPALWCEKRVRYDNRSPRTRSEQVLSAWHWKAPLQQDQRMSGKVDYPVIMLPRRPWWPGIVVDTLVFAAAWLLLLWVRRTIRWHWPVPRPRHLAWTALVLVLAGFATTAIVTMLCVEYSSPHVNYGQSTDGDFGSCYSDDPYGVLYTSISRGAGVRRIRTGFSPRDDEPRRTGHLNGAKFEDMVPSWATYIRPRGKDNVSRVMDLRGWPRPVLWGGYAVRHINDPDAARRGVVIFETVHAELRPWDFPRAFDGSNWLYQRLTPRKVIWRGVAANTIFFAALGLVLVIALLGPGGLRRMWRQAHGRCGRCGYDLRGAGHDRCSECGLAFGGPRSVVTYTLK